MTDRTPAPEPEPDPTPDEAERPINHKHKQQRVDRGIAAELQEWSENR